MSCLLYLIDLCAMHSPSALTEHVSLNLARFFLLDPVSVSDQLTSNSNSPCFDFSEPYLLEEDSGFYLSEHGIGMEPAEVRISYCHK